jgi:hypothetical protein
VHAALTSLPDADQARLGVTADWKTGPHQLTYRQVEHTCRLITRALAKNEPDGAPPAALQSACDRLLEASIPAPRKNGSKALAADWTDLETWSRPPRHGDTQCADPEASWGHCNSNPPGPKGEMLFGYFLSAAVMVTDENGPAVPELARRMTLTGCPLAVRNQRILHAFNTRQAGNARRAAAGLPPARTKRRTTLAALSAPP